MVGAFGAAGIEAFRSNVTLFNEALSAFVNTMPSLFPGAIITLFDTHSFFTSILANPASNGLEPSVISSYCPEYGFVSGDPGVSLPECTFPMSKYFYYDFYHVTFSVHRLLAEGRPPPSQPAL
ncbi:hypothetical protein RQP46_011351 [Phenoliferia psychrophenolica]